MSSRSGYNHVWAPGHELQMPENPLMFFAEKQYREHPEMELKEEGYLVLTESCPEMIEKYGTIVENYLAYGGYQMIQFDQAAIEADIFEVLLEVRSQVREFHIYLNSDQLIWVSGPYPIETENPYIAWVVGDFIFFSTYYQAGGTDELTIRQEIRANLNRIRMRKILVETPTYEDMTTVFVSKSLTHQFSNIYSHSGYIHHWYNQDTSSGKSIRFWVYMIDPILTLYWSTAPITDHDAVCVAEIVQDDILMKLAQFPGGHDTNRIIAIEIYLNLKSVRNRGVLVNFPLSTLFD